MDISCDGKELVKAINDLVKELQKSDFDERQFITEFGKGYEFFGLLRIGRMVNSTESYRSPTGDSSLDKYSNTFFMHPDMDESREFVVTFNKGEANRFISVVNPIKGEPDWTDDEKACISTVVSIIYTYIGNSRLSKRAYYLTFMDSDMNVPNIAATARDTTRILQNGESQLYSSARFNIRRLNIINDWLTRPRANILLRKYLMIFQGVLGADGKVFRIGGDNFYVIFKRAIFEKVKNFLISTEVATDWPDAPRVTIETLTGYLLDWTSFTKVEQIIDSTHRIGLRAHQNKYEPFMITNEEVVRQFRYADEVDEVFPQAIKNEDFLVYYQPKVDSTTDKIVGAEALCRWKRGDEILLPARFVPILERSNKICQLDFYMLERVCKFMRTWLDKKNEPVPISVNFSRIHLWNRDFTDRIESIIDKYSIPHNLIEVELTETTTDVNYELLEEAVNKLHAKGIHTAVDDFGIGYSSLNLVRDLPWDVLKIDRSFLPVADDPKMEKKKAILKHLISITHEMGIKCLAEGAETREQVELLQEYGCTLIQGYYYGKPMSREDMDKKYEEAFGT